MILRKPYELKAKTFSTKSNSDCFFYVHLNINIGVIFLDFLSCFRVCELLAIILLQMYLLLLQIVLYFYLLYIIYYIKIQSTHRFLNVRIDLVHVTEYNSNEYLKFISTRTYFEVLYYFKYTTYINSRSSNQLLLLLISHMYYSNSFNRQSGAYDLSPPFLIKLIVIFMFRTYQLLKWIN